jgi:hypothetical protein
MLEKLQYGKYDKPPVDRPISGTTQAMMDASANEFARLCIEDIKLLEQGEQGQHVIRGRIVKVKRNNN